MKIAFVLYQLSIGGVEKVTVKVVNELSAFYSTDLIVLGTDFKNYEVLDTVRIKEGKIKYSLISRVKRKLKRNITKKYAVHSIKEIEYLEKVFKVNNYDVVIACDGSNALLVNEVLKRKNLNSNIKFITWVHNDYNTYFNNYFKTFKSELGEALSSCETVITLTKEDQRAYSKWNSHTTYIYNPITVDNFQSSELTNKEIIFVARLVKEQKGLDYLIEIGKKLKGSGWIIRVLGDGVNRKWLESQIDALGLTDVFVLEGSVKENIEQYYEQASIFISTSKWEGFGLVITEAMACGLPVVAFENSGPNEILNYGEYGILIPKYDIEAFYQELTQLMNSYEQRKAWSEKSLKRSQDFKIDAICEKWSEIINSTVVVKK